MLRRLFSVWLLILFLPLLQGAAPAPGSVLSELTLANGRVIKNLVILNYTSQALVARWEGGRGTILYRDLQEPLRGQVEQVGRDLAAKNAAREEQRRLALTEPAGNAPDRLPEAKAAAAVSAAPLNAEAAQNSAKPLQLQGQAFLSGGTSAGVQVKFTGMRVTAYPLKEALWAAETNMAKVDWPNPLGSAVTDGEGRWSMTVPDETPFLLVARGVHFATSTGNNNVWEWRVPDTQIEDPSQVLLTDQNARVVSQIWINRKWRDRDHQRGDRGYDGR